MIEYDAKQEITFLTLKLNQWNKEYFEDNNPSVSDTHYDKKFEELKKLEEAYPHLRLPDSPVLVPGSDKTDGFAKFIHDWPMLSIQNAMDDVQLRAWLRKSQPKYGSEYSFAAEYKMDGLALSLMYRNGRLQRAVTRGDGIEGDIVTSNAAMVKGIKLFVNLPPGDVEVRGEVVMSFRVFERYKNDYKNPRNLAAGTMKLHDPSEVAERELEFFVYDIIGGYNDNYWEDRMLYVDHGFTFAPGWLITGDAVPFYCEKMQKDKELIPYPVDGVVIKLCDYQDRDAMGQTSKFHHWQIAYKFKQDQVRSTLLSVDHQVGRTGAITPVANIRPVEMLGTTVRRATLHNYDQIEKLNLGIGDTVLMEKGGEIIPKVVGVEKRTDGDFGVVKPPETCPSCMSIPVKDGAIYRCTNQYCPAQLQGNIEHFVSKKCMNMKGIGPSAVERMIKNGLISIDGLFDYNIYELEEMGFGEIEASNIYDAIQDSMRVELWRFIHSFGIHLIGNTASKALADYYQDIGEMMEEICDFTQGEIDGFGPEMTHSLVDWFVHNYDLVETMLDAGVEPYYIKKKESKFSGNKVCITGKLSNPRDMIKQKLEAIGIKVVSSVSSETDYLLCGDKAGSKLKKAKDLGIEIVDEIFFGI